MNWEPIINALAIVLIIEGFMPFLSPRSWKDLVREVLKLEDRHIRLIGLSSLMAGTLLICFI